MRIALTVGSPVRDLAGMVLLGGELSQRGASCFLVPLMLCQKELGALAPDFVLLPNMRRESRNLCEGLSHAGIAIGVLDAEGGVLPSIEWYEDALHPDADLRARIACFCAWGERMAQEAKTRAWFPSEKIYLTGHPRFDFHAPDFRDVRLPHSPDAQKYRRPLVLISGRYSAANPEGKSSAQKIERLAQIRNYSEEYTRAYLQAQQTGMRQICDLTNTLAASYPNVNFVYRPHPFERLETYRQEGFLDERENLIISREGSIEGWLGISDAIIHRGCTTAIEGGMRDVPALSPRWVATAEEIESSESVSIGCENIGQLHVFISALSRGEKIVRPPEIVAAHADVISQWFYRSDGLAHERVSDAILLSLEKQASTPDAERCRALFQNAKGGPHSVTGQALKAIGKWSDPSIAKWKNSKAHFDAEWTNGILSAMAKCDEDRFGNLHATSAEARGEYRVRYEEGCSVAISATSKNAGGER